MRWLLKPHRHDRSARINKCCRRARNCAARSICCIARAASRRIDRDMFGGVLDLRELAVSDVMIHRTNMITLNADDPPEDVVNAVIASPVTRVPLWRGNPENIVGILHVKDLLRALHAVDGDAAKVDIAAVADAAVVRARTCARCRSSSRRSAAARRSSRWWSTNTARSRAWSRSRTSWRRSSATSPTSTTSRCRACARQPDGSVNVDGAVPIRDLNRVMDWNLPDQEATTVAGLVIHEARSIPEVGPELHVPRLPLPGAAARAQSHHRAAHPAAAAQAVSGKGGLDAAFAPAPRRGWRARARRPQLIRKRCVNHAVALDPGLTFEGVRHDMNPEMSLSARPGAGMACMPVRIRPPP